MRLLLLCLPLAAVALPGCSDAHGHETVHFPGEVPHAFPEPDTSMIEQPELEYFPCSECHDPELYETDPERRELEMAHDDIVLQHDEEHRWCLDCHDPDDRDVLRLASGEQVPFEQSYRLCGQCHGDKYRDWKAGVHGRREGSWQDSSQQDYLLCVHCHNSHSPRFEPIEPLPMPTAPEVTQ